MLHLRVLVSHFDVEHIPPAVRARYLPHIGVLTIVGSYPVYDTIFDGSQLTRLKTVYLRNEGSSSSINQQFASAFPPPSSIIARIQGADDREYIEKGLRKLQVSRLNWWQAEKSRWLHGVLDADRPSNFQLIISQEVRIMFIAPVPTPQVRHISLELLFDAANGTLVHRKVMMPEEEDDARELRDEGEILAYFR